jgi:hypothetical protein
MLAKNAETTINAEIAEGQSYAEASRVGRRPFGSRRAGLWIERSLRNTSRANQNACVPEAPLDPCRAKRGPTRDALLCASLLLGDLCVLAFGVPFFRLKTELTPTVAASGTNLILVVRLRRAGSCGRSTTLAASEATPGSSTRPTVARESNASIRGGHRQTGRAHSAAPARCAHHALIGDG